MKRILLVEDDADVRPLMAHVLIGSGHNIDVVDRVAKARALLASGTYDLVLTDGRLPDGNGIEVADEAKARGIPAVVVTAFALTYSPAELARHEYLLKPVRPSELLSVVRRYARSDESAVKDRRG